MKRLLVLAALAITAYGVVSPVQNATDAVCADEDALRVATMRVLDKAGLKGDDPKRLAELRLWVATVEPPCLRARYQAWIDFEVEYQAGALEREESSIRANALIDQLPMPPTAP